MAVIELNVTAANQESAAQPKTRPEWLRWRHWRKSVAGAAVATIALLGIDAYNDNNAARVTAAEKQEAYEQGLAQATADAQLATMTAQRMNAWLDRRLAGGEQPATGGMIGGVVEFLENGEVTSTVKNPLVITSEIPESEGDEPPNMWVLIQGNTATGRPVFSALWLGEDTDNMRTRIWGVDPTTVNLAPCPRFMKQGGAVIGVCAADIRTGETFSPQIFPGAVVPAESP